MSKEKRMSDDLIEIFDEEYNKANLITPQFTADKLIAKGYRKQSEGEWLTRGLWNPQCSLCHKYNNEETNSALIAERR